MAKAKKQKAPGQYAGIVADEKFYYLPSGLLVKADGTPVEPGQAKRYAPLLEPFVPPAPEQSKETLEEAFPETYEEPRQKKRQARKKSNTVEQKEAAEKLASDLARDVQDLKEGLGALATLMKEDSALIRQQLTTQQRSITLLTEIAKNIAGGGGSGGLNVPSITKGFGWKGLLAAGLGGLALGGLGGYFLNDYLSDNEEEDKTSPEDLVPDQQEQPRETANIQEAQNRGEQKAEILNIDARELSFNSDKLSFEVNELTIDADNIKSEGAGGLNGGSGGGGSGGGGGGGGTGTAGGGAAVGPASNAFDPSAVTPAGPSGVKGETIGGGSGAFKGFTGKAPTPDSIKEDVVKAGKFSGSAGGTGKTGKQFEDNSRFLMDNLKKDYGLSREQAAGIIGWWGGESGLDPGINEMKPLVPGSRGGFGIAQWTGPRRKALEEFAEKNNMPLSSVQTQYMFFKEEVKKYPQFDKIMKNVKNAGDLRQAILAFQEFQTGGDPRAIVALGRRFENANRALSIPDAKQLKSRQLEIPQGIPIGPGDISGAQKLQPVPFTKTPIAGGTVSDFSKLDQSELDSSRSTDAMKSMVAENKDALNAQAYEQDPSLRPEQTDTAPTPPPVPEAPTPTAPAITPSPEPNVSTEFPSGGLMQEPTFGRYGPKMDKAGFDLEGPTGDTLAFYTRRPHKAFLYLTPEMKTPNIGVGGQ